MTNQSIRALYGSLVAMTLQLDNALSQKLDARGFLHSHLHCFPHQPPPTNPLRSLTMSKTFKQQPKQPKPVREAAQRYKRERRKEQAKEWKSALEWRLGKDD
jgi:hypothetical protein